MALFQLAGLTVNARSKSGPTVAQSWRVTRSDPQRPRKAIDAAALERLALHYAGRYATTRAKLAAYLARKIGERGWEGDDAAPIEALVARFTELGYVNDRSFAEARGAALARRGFGERRIGMALKIAGITEEDAEPVREEARRGAHDSAMAFARRKRIGPFAQQKPDRDQRQRLLAAMLRAGHSPQISRIIVNSEPGAEIDPEAT
jgi:regulatory protein